MAHSAPVPSDRGPGARRPVPTSPTSPASRTSPTSPASRQHPERRTPPARRPSLAAWSLPLLLGVLYGCWAAQMDRNAGGDPRFSGPITTGNVLFGVVSGLVVAVLGFLLHRMSWRLPREARAAAWGAFAGAGLGYLYALTNASVVRTVVVGILTAAGVYAMTFYRYYTSE